MKDTSKKDKLKGDMQKLLEEMQGSVDTDVSSFNAVAETQQKASQKKTEQKHGSHTQRKHHKGHKKHNKKHVEK